MIYYGRRYYNASQGRFLGRDPIDEDGGPNLYGFCLNNAVNAWDRLGMDVQYLDGNGSAPSDLNVGKQTLAGTVMARMANVGLSYGSVSEAYQAGSILPSSGSVLIGEMMIQTASGSWVPLSSAVAGNFGTAGADTPDSGAIFNIDTRLLGSGVTLTARGHALSATPASVATAAIQADNGVSIANDIELGEVVYLNADGTLGYTLAIQNPKSPGIDMFGQAPNPSGTVPIATWHTHGNSPNGNNISSDNVNYKNYYNVPGFVGTPSGSILMNPAEGVNGWRADIVRTGQGDY